MELVTVIALTSVILTMLLTVTISVAKHNAYNLARQERVDGTRQVSVWLTDALAHAAPLPGSDTGTVFEVAEPRKMVFTAALPKDAALSGFVSRVTLVVDQACWPGGDEEPGVLRRCVQDPVIGADGTQSFCAYGASGCDEGLFDEFVVARNVADGAVFGYALEGSAGVLTQSVADASSLGQLAAVELRVTVAGEPGSTGENIQATVVKRHNVKGWSKL
jgi:hypothetical protein